MEIVLDTKDKTKFGAETEVLVFKPSPIHGLGGFAKSDIRNGARLIEYVGEKISKTESIRRCEENNEYIFSLNEREDLDGNVAWNPARFLNHSCAPNCDAELDGGRIWIVARREIKAGEEITFNYGFDLEDYREYPCRCGSPNCIGFIVAEEYFDSIKAQRTDLDSPPPAAGGERMPY
jgi:SET domain-containing protein